MSDHQGRSDGSDIPIPDQRFSVHVSRTLDCLGKSRDMVKYRVKMYREIQRLANKRHDIMIYAGSKAEGLTSIFESDSDLMFVIPDSICADNAEQFRDTHSEVFQTERHYTPAGYTKLKLIQCNISSDSHWLQDSIKDSMFQDECGNRYASSDFLMTNVSVKMLDDEQTKCLERSGPSIPLIKFKSDTYASHADIVPAFCCVCPDLLQAFITRPRLYNRPDMTILNDISKLGGHAVPVGCKGSETSYQEWRICYTKAEIRLINSFKDIESKLYILLKMVSKIAKTFSIGVSSYVMKNVVLWLIELYPADMFTEELLTTRLIQALVFLTKCVEANFLPSYMIPERNLLPQMFDPIQRHKLTTFLNELIQEGGYVMMRYEKLRVAMLVMYRKPCMAENFKMLRGLVEKLCLFQIPMRFKKQGAKDLSPQQVEDLLDTDETYKTIQIVLLNCLVPEWKELRMSGCSGDFIFELFLERDMLLLS